VHGRRAEEAIPGWTTIATFVPVADRPGEADGPSSAETVPVEVGGRELWLSIVAVALDDDTVYAFRDCDARPPAREPPLAIRGDDLA
jgi:hypothetical protein